MDISIGDSMDISMEISMDISMETLWIYPWMDIEVLSYPWILWISISKLIFQEYFK